MYFEEREIQPYAEPISSSELKENSVYFSLNYADDELLVPSLEPLVFIGRDLELGDSGKVYFQDIDSYLRGVGYASATEDSDVRFYVGSEKEVNHIFEFERALEELMRCSLRRIERRTV